MEPLNSLPRLLIVMGVVFVVVGLWLQLGPGLPGLGKLPGDLDIERPGFRLRFPIVSCLVVSVVLTLLLNLFSRLR